MGVVLCYREAPAFTDHLIQPVELQSVQCVLQSIFQFALGCSVLPVNCRDVRKGVQHRVPTRTQNRIQNLRNFCFGSLDLFWRCRLNIVKVDQAVCTKSKGATRACSAPVIFNPCAFKCHRLCTLPCFVYCVKLGSELVEFRHWLHRLATFNMDCDIGNLTENVV
jgi:hypothetical protein